MSKENRIGRRTIAAATVAAALTAGLTMIPQKTVQAQVTLGAFTFNNSQFGNILTESDGGVFSASNWLNLVNADPGNPAYLTGTNFDTGIANIPGSVTYTIGYTTPIVNGAGNDFAIIAGYDTFADASGSTVTLSVSTDGIGFSPAQTLTTGSIATGEFRNYLYAGTGPFPTELFVLPLDLSSFGIAPGGSIAAVRFFGDADGADVIPPRLPLLRRSRVRWLSPVWACCRLAGPFCFGSEGTTGPPDPADIRNSKKDSPVNQPDCLFLCTLYGCGIVKEGILVSRQALLLDFRKA
jgi:hypothetical protein